MVTDTSNISRDAQVARQTVQGYFDILIDTLLGHWLPAFRLKRATKLVVHPKFYFFDAGVARALGGRIAYPPTGEELGTLFETYLIPLPEEVMGRHPPLRASTFASRKSS
jgi:predicted AAA+ superfamily ATPase